MGRHSGHLDGWDRPPELRRQGVMDGGASGKRQEAKERERERHRERERGREMHGYISLSLCVESYDYVHFLYVLFYVFVFFLHHVMLFSWLRLIREGEGGPPDTWGIPETINKYNRKSK